MVAIFQDWTANKSNIKGRIVLLMYRIANSVYKSHRFIRWIAIPYVIFYRLTVEWILGIELPWKLNCGPNLRLYHGQALVVNDKTILGEGCILRNSTTIGVARTDDGFKGGAPNIGNFVDVGANSIIIGNIKIGDHVVIGAGSVVINDIPPNAVVVGNPARVLKFLN